jgi:F0F1-type ATP synthase membrane subunit b/b'
MANPKPDMTVADAMNRVLAVEREAAVAIAAAEADAESQLRAAREQRRKILDRARDRASRVHVRAQARLAEELARLDARAQAAGDLHEPLESIAQRAIDRLAGHLASGDHESP